MPTVQLYSLPQVVSLTVALSAGGSPYMSYHHTRADFRLFHGVRNDIDFIIRDADRRVIALTEGEILTVHISHRETKRVIIEQDLVAIAAEKGHYRLVLGPLATMGAQNGIYRYSVTKTAVTSERTILFMDRDHGPSSTVEILDGPIPTRPDPIVIRPETLLVRDDLHYTGAYPGAFLVGNFTGEHTILLQMSGYSGEITVQASLEYDIPNADVDWFTVTSESFETVTENRFVSFTGNFYHVRFILSSVDGMTAIQYSN